MSKRGMNAFAIACVSAVIVVGGLSVASIAASSTPDGSVAMPVVGGPPDVPPSPHAQPVPVDGAPQDVAGAAATLAAAIRSSNWRLAVVAGILLIVLVLRLVGSRIFPWIGTDRGGALLALAVGVLSALCLGVASGHVDWQTIVDGVVAALIAMGAWSGGKRIAR